MTGTHITPNITNVLLIETSLIEDTFKNLKRGRLDNNNYDDGDDDDEDDKDNNNNKTIYNYTIIKVFQPATTEKKEFLFTIKY